MDNGFKKFIVLWLSQGISQLGSSMTAFALVLWAYERSGSAFLVSMLSFCNYVPYILVSMFSGAFVDRHSKKKVMLFSDTAAAAGTLAVLLIFASGQLSLYHIYIVNAVVGITTAFQQPAAAVAAGRLVPKDKISNMSGMNSFSENLVIVLSPMIAAACYAAGGLSTVLVVDIASFTAAFLLLLFFIHIPENIETGERVSPFSGMSEGFAFLKKEKGILYIMLVMSLVNFFSRLTYENILSPMVLARSGGDSIALGIVNAFMGMGGIAGGIIVSLKKESRHTASTIFIATALSFMFGDLVMAAGRNTTGWSIAAVGASLPIPFIMAGQNTILYRRVPGEMQGRVFAVRSAVQYGTVPLGIILGGFLADYVFEPLMRSGSEFAGALSHIVGSGAGCGMAVMFLCTGVCGFAVSMLALTNREIRRLNDI